MAWKELQLAVSQKWLRDGDCRPGDSWECCVQLEEPLKWRVNIISLSAGHSPLRVDIKAPQWIINFNLDYLLSA